MTKLNELEYGSSCFNKALLRELIFVGLARDAAAPAMVEAWARERIRLGLNEEGDVQIREAMSLAEGMRGQRPEIRRELERREIESRGLSGKDRMVGRWGGER